MRSLLSLLCAAALLPSALAATLQARATNPSNIREFPAAKMPDGLQSPAPLPASALPTKFAMLLFPTYELLDVFGPLDALTLLSGSHRMELSLISNADTLDPVSSAPRSASMNPHNNTFATSVVPTHTFATAPQDIEVLFIPGGLGTRAPDLNATVAYIRDAYPRLRWLVTVCTGAGLAARAGVLDGRLATTNKGGWNATVANGPSVRWVRSARWTVDGNVWTGSGVSAGIDVTLAWVEHVFGSEDAWAVAESMEYLWRNDASNDPFAV